MERIRHSRLVCLILFALIAIIYENTAFAQIDPKANVVRKPFREIAGVMPFNTRLLIQKQAIKFKPFVMTDLGTGTTPTSKITLKNGKTLTATQYLEELNSCEQRLNAKGYSLRTLGTDLTNSFRVLSSPLGPQQKSINRSNLQIPNSGPPAPLRLENFVNSAEAKTMADENFQVDKQFHGFISGSQPKSICNPSINVNKTWFKGPLGDASLFGTEINGDVILSGTLYSKQIEASYHVQVDVFGEHLDLAKITTKLNIDTTGTAKAVYDCVTLGESSPVVKTTLCPVQDYISSNLETGVSGIFDLYGIPIYLSARIFGGSEFVYAIIPNKSTVEVIYTPIFIAQVALSASVDLLVAEAGTGGNFTIIDDRVPSQIKVFNSSQFSGVQSGTSWVNAEYDIYNNMTALSGLLYVYVTITYPCIAWPPVCEKTLSGNIVEWPGIVDAHTVLKGFVKSTCGKPFTRTLIGVLAPRSLFDQSHNSLQQINR
jgi:hypothetical protein